MGKAVREDYDFADEVSAARHQGPPKATYFFLFCVALMLGSFLTWSYYAEIDEVTRGTGQVIPSSKTQLVQSLESGIVKKIAVHIGDTVRKGQLLLQIDDTNVAANLGELRAKEVVLLGQIVRLRAELTAETDTRLSFPETLTKRAAMVVSNEQQLFMARQRSLNNQIGILRERLQQRKQQLDEAHASTKRFKSSMDIAQREHNLKAPLAKKGIVPKTDMLQLEREITNIKGQLDATEISIPRLQAAIREAERQIEEQKLSFRQTAQSELNERLSDLSVVTQTLKSATDKVVRADIRSPVDGVINKLNVNTVGGVVKAGETMLEIVPVEDTLLIEAEIKPSDIAFVHVKQAAVVKITAYDFSIYGGLEGWVERISPDTAFNEETRERFYTVAIRTKKMSLGNGKKVMTIIPGMVASVDILTGKKSVLNYLLKPIIKAKNEALRER